MSAVCATPLIEGVMFSPALKLLGLSIMIWPRSKYRLITVPVLPDNAPVTV